MQKIALIYSFNSSKTAKAATKVMEEMTASFELTSLNAETLTANEIKAFDKFIIAVPTWFDGELPNYWDEFVPELEDIDLAGKTFAIFGPGDQKGYPENFVDGIGIMAEHIEAAGGKIIGFTPAEGYSFERSRALRAKLFCGLPLDFENQARLNTTRIASWCKQLKNEF
jgi:flavodoxin I